MLIIIIFNRLKTQILKVLENMFYLVVYLSMQTKLPAFPTLLWLKIKYVLADLCVRPEIFSNINQLIDTPTAEL